MVKEVRDWASAALPARSSGRRARDCSILAAAAQLHHLLQRWACATSIRIALNSLLPTLLNEDSVRAAPMRICDFGWD